MKLKIDLHVHTKCSPDGFMDVSEVIERARTAGLSGIAITDHNTCGAVSEALKIGKKENFLVIPGAEVKSRSGDIIGLGITESPKKGMGARETISMIHELGGIAIAAHPYSILFHPCKMRGTVKTAGFDAIEVFNARTYVGNGAARKAALSLGIPMTAGSDSHTASEIGSAYTVVDCERADASSVIDAIRAGRTEVVGKRAAIGSVMGWYYRRVKRLF